MSSAALRSLIAHAVVDRQLCRKLLDGERHLVLADFDLSDEERAALATFRGVSLRGFAAELETWMAGQGAHRTATRGRDA